MENIRKYSWYGWEIKFGQTLYLNIWKVIWGPPWHIAVFSSSGATSFSDPENTSIWTWPLLSFGNIRFHDDGDDDLYAMMVMIMITTIKISFSGSSFWRSTTASPKEEQRFRFLDDEELRMVTALPFNDSIGKQRWTELYCKICVRLSTQQPTASSFY